MSTVYRPKPLGVPFKFHLLSLMKKVESHREAKMKICTERDELRGNVHWLRPRLAETS